VQQLPATPDKQKDHGKHFDYKQWTPTTSVAITMNGDLFIVKLV
jgi:hypothetical protein